MVDNRISKVFVSSVAALLLLSSVVFLAGTQADASDDLQILDIFEPAGTPPPDAWNQALVFQGESP